MPPCHRLFSPRWPESPPSRSCRRCSLLRRSFAKGSERAPDRLPELAALFLLRRGVLDLPQLLQQLALLGRHLGRRPDVNPHMQVAMTTFAEPRQPFVAQAIGHAG